MSTQNEKLTITEVLDGNTDQYTILVDRYHRGLCVYLFNMLHDEMQAEDIAQEAFLTAFKKLKTFNPSYAFSTWLYRIARNLALKSINKNKNAIASYDPQVIEVPATESLEQTVSQDELSTEIQDAILNLKPEYQEVINLYYWNEKSYDEISEILDKPVGTIRTWLRRSKQSLREELYG